MGAEKILPVKGRKVKIDGKEYVIRFTMRTIGELAAKYGNVSSVFQKFSPMAGGQIGNDELTAIADLVSAGLKRNHPDITVDYVMDNFDIGDITAITETLVAAFMDVVGKGEAESGGEPTPQTA